jgi:hypothetical protein
MLSLSVSACALVSTAEAPGLIVEVARGLVELRWEWKTSEKFKLITKELEMGKRRS